MDTQQEPTTATAAPTVERAKRTVRTRLFVHFEEPDGTEGLTPGFESKKDLDVWLRTSSVRPLRIIRGVEKRFSNKVSLT